MRHCGYSVAVLDCRGYGYSSRALADMHATVSAVGLLLEDVFGVMGGDVYIGGIKLLQFVHDIVDLIDIVALKRREYFKTEFSHKNKIYLIDCLVEHKAFNHLTLDEQWPPLDDIQSVKTAVAVLLRRQAECQHGAVMTPELSFTYLMILI